MIPADVLTIARNTLTDKQLDVWLLVHDGGMSIRGTALHLGLHRSTAVDRYDAACLNLHRAGVKFTPDGRPYLEETA